jgi:hypothetical protein
MALKLIPPGKRGSSYVIRGRVGGVLIERSAKTSNLAQARSRLRELEAQLGDVPTLGQVTFAQAAQKYIEFRNPSRVDRQRLEKVVNAIGSRRYARSLQRTYTKWRADLAAGLSLRRVIAITYDRPSRFALCSGGRAVSVLRVQVVQENRELGRVRLAVKRRFHSSPPQRPARNASS